MVRALSPRVPGRPVSELSQLTVLARLLCRNRVGDFGPEGVCRFASRSLLGHGFGAELAPGGSSLFCFDCIALWVTVSARNLVRKVQRKDFSGASVKAELRPWEPGPSLASLKCDPSKMREFQQNGDKIMYQNKVSLIGFLGRNAEVRNANNRSFTTFSLATKSSYKDKEKGEYVSHTEWHHCVVFGKLAEFAATLSKGEHVQVEGEIRTREYDSKKTGEKEAVTEIRVGSILKLDRAEKASPEDDGNEESAA
jgi:single-strand DNA-binding protein